MSYVTQHLKTPFKLGIRDAGFLKYGAVALVGLLALLEFNAVVLGFLVLFIVLGLAFMEKVNKIDGHPKVSGTVVGERFVDGGTFREFPAKRDLSSHAVVSDGGSFERFKY